MKYSNYYIPSGAPLTDSAPKGLWVKRTEARAVINGWMHRAPHGRGCCVTNSGTVLPSSPWSLWQCHYNDVTPVTRCHGTTVLPSDHVAAMNVAGQICDTAFHLPIVYSEVALVLLPSVWPEKQWLGLFCLSVCQFSWAQFHRFDERCRKDEVPWDVTVAEVRWRSDSKTRFSQTCIWFSLPHNALRGSRGWSLGICFPDCCPSKPSSCQWTVLTTGI